MQRFQELGTVLAIDHVSKAVSRGNMSKATPFRSVFKRNIARSTFNLAPTDGGGLVLTADKSNFGPKQDLLCYSCDFVEDKVFFRQHELTDEVMVGALQHLSTYDATFLAISEVYKEKGDRVTPEDVVNWRTNHDDIRSVSPGTIRNHFTKLKLSGKIRIDDGCAIPK